MAFASFLPILFFFFGSFFAEFNRAVNIDDR